MSLSREAILRIEELTAAGMSAPPTDFSKIILPSGVEIGDLEKYQMFRNQFRGRMTTDSINDFVEYCNIQAAGACFINREDITAKAIFDIGNKDQPGHCKHWAFIELMRTAAFMAMRSRHDQRLTQQDLAEYLEDWREDMDLFDTDNKPIPVNAAIAAVRKVTIKESSESEHNVQGYSASTSGMDKMDATSGADNLPGFLTFKCEPYNGLSNYEFNLRISLILTGGEPVFILRPIKFDVVMEKISEEFKDLITEDLHKDVIPYMGFFDPRG